MKAKAPIVVDPRVDENVSPIGWVAVLVPGKVSVFQKDAVEQLVCGALIYRRYRRMIARSKTTGRRGSKPVALEDRR